MSDVDLVSMVGGLSVGKPEDTDSIADSEYGPSSVVTGATSEGLSQFEVRHQQLLCMEADNRWPKTFSTSVGMKRRFDMMS